MARGPGGELLRPPQPGKYQLTVALRHGITTAVIATRAITITVA